MGVLNLTEAASHLGLIGPRVEPPPPPPPMDNYINRCWFATTINQKAQRPGFVFLY